MLVIADTLLFQKKKHDAFFSEIRSRVKNAGQDTQKSSIHQVLLPVLTNTRFYLSHFYHAFVDKIVSDSIIITSFFKKGDDAMTEVMTPSNITAGQIGKLQELLSARLRKSGLPSDSVQRVLEDQGDAIANDMLAIIRKRVEAISSLIVRHVAVDRARSPEAVIAATGRNKYVNDDVVKTMPRGEGPEADVCFFKLNRWISDDDLEKEYALRGLKSADPYSLAAVNEADPAFADDHPNGTHWKNAEGKWCGATFSRWLLGERGVSVERGGRDWHDAWWFAGLRK